MALSYTKSENCIMMHQGAISELKKRLHTWVAVLTEDEFLQDVIYAFGSKDQRDRKQNRIVYKSFYSSRHPATLIVDDEIIINGIMYKNRL